MSAQADAISALNDRIVLSLEAGEPLNGWTYVNAPVNRIETRRDKASLEMAFPEITEDSGGTRIAKTDAVVLFRVSTAKPGQRDGRSVMMDGVKAHLDNLAALKNAVEKDTGSPRSADLMLGGKLIEPMRWTRQATEQEDDSFNTMLELTMRLRAELRASR